MTEKGDSVLTLSPFLHAVLETGGPFRAVPDVGGQAFVEVGLVADHEDAAGVGDEGPA